MGGHRERADLEPFRDLFFYQTLGEELKNFQLATGDLEALLTGWFFFAKCLQDELGDLRIQRRASRHDDLDAFLDMWDF